MSRKHFNGSTKSYNNNTPSYHSRKDTPSKSIKRDRDRDIPEKTKKNNDLLYYKKHILEPVGHKSSEEWRTMVSEFHHPETDVHTVKLSTGIATLSQIHQALDTVSRRAQDILKLRDPPDFRVNLINNKTGKSGGYLYTPHTEFYYLLIGNPPTGPVENVRKEMSYEMLLKFLGPPENLDLWAKDCSHTLPVHYYKWVDTMDTDDYIKPVLDTTHLYTYTEEQNKWIWKEYGKTESPYMAFKPAIPREISTRNYPNVLVSITPIPPWLSMDRLYSIFNYYNNSSRKIEAPVYDKNFKVISRVTQKYPIIELSGDMKIRVIYDPKTNDATFALLMCLKITDSTTPSHSIIFGYHEKRLY